MNKLTNKQNLQLSQFAYMVLGNSTQYALDNYKGMKLKDIVTEASIEGWLENIRPNAGLGKGDFEALLEAMTEDGNPLGNLVLTDIADESNGFYAYAFKEVDSSGNDTGDTVFAFRGSDGEPFTGEPDWNENFKLFINDNKQFDSAYLFVMSNKGAGNINVTGHSLGGALAMYVASHFDNCTGAVFDAPGIGQCLDNDHENRLKNSGLVNYVAKYDFVGSVLLHPENRIFVEENNSFEVNDGATPNSGLFNSHFTQAFKFNGDSLIPTNDAGPVQVIVEAIGDLLWNVKEIPQTVWEWIFGGGLEDREKSLATAIAINLTQNGYELSAGTVSDLVMTGRITEWLQGLVENNISTASSMTRLDPIVLDLNGDGISTRERSVFFDLDVDGKKEYIGWVNGEDGLLVKDTNNNGIIDDGYELFRNGNKLSTGEYAKGGFDELLDIDKNKDGVLDGKDNIFEQLKVWIDKNQDGISQSEELKSLRDLGIQKINLYSQIINQEQDNGNIEAKVGSYIDKNGNEQKLAEYWFDRNDGVFIQDYISNNNIERIEDYTGSDEIADMPELYGMGLINSLRYSMSLNSDLKDLVNLFINEKSRNNRLDLVDKILASWADAGNTQKTNGRTSTLIDIKKVVILEQVAGRSFTGDLTLSRATNILNNIYNDLKNKIYLQLMSQTQLKSIIDETSVMIGTKGGDKKFYYDIVGTVDFFNDAFKINSKQGMELLIDFNAITKESGYSDIILNTESIYLILNKFSDCIEAKKITEFLIQNPNITNIIILKEGELSNVGTNDSDLIIGSGGNETINGGIGNDTLIGGVGDDKLYGGEGQDSLDGNEGTDYMEGGSGNDTYIFGRGYGQDTIYDYDASAGNIDIIKLADGITAEDVTLSRNGNDLVIGIKGTSDTLKVNSYFAGTSVWTGTGWTTNYDSYKVEQIQFADGTVWDTAYVKNSVVQATEDSNILYGYESNDAINGLGGNDTIYGYEGNDTLVGGTGDDKLYGGAGEDSLEGNEGTDYMEGGSGNDTYIFGRGYGQDTIYDYDASAGNIDIIKIAEGLTTEDLFLSSNGTDLIIGIKESSDALTIRNYFAGEPILRGTDWAIDYDPYKIEKIEFADGTIWDKTYIKNAGLYSLYGGKEDDNINGTSGNDTIFGYEGKDTLIGGTGDDKLYGGAGEDSLDGNEGTDYMEGGSGNDTYIFGRGYGQDTIYDYDTTAGNIDIIKMSEGITAEEVILRRNESDLIITIKGTNDTLKVNNYFAETSVLTSIVGTTNYDLCKVEQIQFADGTVWDTAYVKNEVIHGTEESNILYGYESNDVINGLGGNDTIYSYEGNDTLVGGTGDDKLYGGAGEDSLDGNEGTDYMEGGSGNDTYIFGRGHGQDTIYDYDASAGNIDIIELADGITAEDVTLSRNGNDLVIGIKGTNDTLKVSSYFAGTSVWTSTGWTTNYNTYKVEQIQFADGTVWDTAYVNNEVIHGTEESNILYGYESNDVINGLGGNDTIIGYEGNDTLVGGVGDDKLYGGEGEDSLDGNEGTDYMEGGSGNDTLVGGVGDDKLYGGAGEDSLDGNEGTDYMEGGSGNDTYIFGRGYGQDTIYDADSTPGNIDIIKLADGITAEDITLSRNWNDLVIGIKGTSDTLKVNNYFAGTSVWTSTGWTTNYDTYKVEQIQFADGTVWDIAYVKNAVTIQATEESNILYGYESNDVIKGLGGNDTLYGYEGKDTLVGGVGDDKLYGGAGEDSLDGNEGTDYMEGGSGNDTYIFGRGYGQDTIYDYDASAGNIDIIKMAEGITATDVILSRNESDLIITIKGTNDTLKVSSYFAETSEWTSTGWTTNYDSHKVEQIQFTDGTVWDTNFVRNSLIQITDNDNTVYGYESNDVINGLGGNDTLYGYEGKDTLVGGTGDDKLYGGAGEDSLDGNEGTDYMEGGSGNDTYIFGRGYGQDTIYDADSTAGNIDIIKLADGITAEDITLSRNGNDLVIGIKGTSDTLKVNSYFAGTSVWTSTGWTTNYDTYKVEQIQFADGTVWDTAYVKNEVIHGTEESNILYGYESNDVINGLGGNDTIFGYEGNDTLVGGVGDDKLYGGAGEDSLDGNEGTDYMEGGSGNDTYIFGRGYGQDTIYDYDASAGNIDIIKLAEGITTEDVILSRNQSDLVITIKGTNDTLKVSGYFAGTSEWTTNYDSYKVEQIQFADGTVWDIAYVKNAVTIQATEESNILYGYESNDVINGLGGNDTIYSYEGNDTLVGGIGDDKLYGGAGEDSLDGNEGTDYMEGGSGNDTYIFGRGYGQDTIYDYDTSARNIDIIKLADGITAEDVTLSRNGNDLVIGIKGTSDTLKVNSYFAGTSVWTSTGWTTNYDSYKVEQIQFADGTAWDTAYVKNEVIHGTEESNILYGYESNDVINGLGGNDTIYSYEGNDTLAGGVGDDKLYGGAGEDSLDGNEGTDYMEGGSGNDTYIFGRGYGQDTIYDADSTAGNIDIIKLADGITAEDITLSRNANDLVIGIKGTSDTLKVNSYFAGTSTGWTTNYDSYKVEQIQFADGTVWDTNFVRNSLIQITDNDDTVYGYESNDVINGLGGNDTLYGYEGKDTLVGGTGDDKLYGGAGEDSLDGNEGTDYMEGGSGNDTYIFGRGYGQDAIYDYDTTAGNIDIIKLAEGITAEDVILSRNESDLIIAIRGTNDTLKVSGYFEETSGWTTNSYKVEQIQFTDGTVWDTNFVRNTLMQPTDNSDTIYGYKSNDTISGLGGNDTIYGNEGNDTLIGGVGDDKLYGGAGEDKLNGNEGTDYMVGGSGNDTYIFSQGYGEDTIYDYDTTTGNIDIIKMAEGITSEDVILSRNESDLIIKIKGTNDTLKVSSYFAGTSVWTSTGWTTNYDSYKVEQIQFTDGTVWDTNFVRNSLIQITDNDDTVYGYESDDTINGLGGNDTIYGHGGNDTLIGGAGDDRLYGDEYGDAGKDILDGSQGTDYMDGGNGNDTYIFGLGYGQDTICDYDSTAGNIDIIKMAEGITAEDVILSRNESDLIITIKGTNDSLKVSSYFEAASFWTTNYDSFKVEQIQFTDGTVWDIEYVENAVIEQTDNDDTIYGYESNDMFNGLSGNDTIYGNEGNDTLIGGVGDDKLYGGAGEDHLDGNEGTDYMEGGSGNDTYIFGRGYGQDTIYDNDSDIGNMDVIKLADDILEKDIILSCNESDLIIGIKGTSDTLKISNYFSGTSTDGTVNYDSDKIEQIQFADGTVWDKEYIKNILAQATDENNTLHGYESNDTLNGLGGNDYIYGFDGNDSLTGGDGDDGLFGGKGDDILNGSEGNDIMEGGVGSDTYIFGKGSGQDTINEIVTDVNTNDTDIIKLADGITINDISLNYEGDDLVLNIKGTNDTLRISNYLPMEYGGSLYISEPLNKIEQIQFSDGTILDTAKIKNLMLQASNANDNLYGFDEDDFIQGLDGNDSIYGWSGDDKLYGENGDDILDGSYGNDYIEGGKGSDTYIFGAYYGCDVIFEDDSTEGNIDRIKLLDNIKTDDITLKREEDNLVLSIKGKLDKLVINNYFSSTSSSEGVTTYNSKVEQIVFVDGTIWDSGYIENKVQQSTDSNNIINGTDDTDFIYGTEEADTIDAKGGYDMVYGYGGNDYINGGDGGSAIYGGDGDDTIIGGNGYNTLMGEDGNDKLYSEGLFNSMFGGTGDDTLTGGAGYDYLYGEDGNDILDGKGNNDTLYGEKGNDTYLFGRGYNQDTILDQDGIDDIIKLGEGVKPEDVTLTLSDGDDLILKINGTEDILTIYDHFSSGQIEHIQFTDGTIWDTLFIKDKLLHGTEENDEITGYETDDVMSGLGGDDLIYGGDGNDTIDGGTGNDYIAGDAGDDRLYGKEGNDSLYGGSGVNILDGGEGDDNLYGGNGNDTIDGGTGNDYIAGDAGDDRLYGKEGNDSLYGGSGVNILDGGEGDDNLYGGSELDTYIYNKGYGKDIIHTVSDDINWGYLASNDWNGTMWDDGGGDAFDGFGETSITVNGQTISNINVGIDDGNEQSISVGEVIFKSKVKFIHNNILEISIKPGEGFEGVSYSIMNGGNLGSDSDANHTEGYVNVGDNQMKYMYCTDNSGSDPNIFYMMTPENNTYGQPTYQRNGDNVSAYLDNITGGVKIYIIPNRITKEDAAFAMEGMFNVNDIKMGVLRLGENILPDNITLNRSGMDLIIRMPTETDEIKVKDWYSGKRLKQIEFTDGTVWDQDIINTQTIYVTGTEADDSSIYGTDGDNIMKGLAGNDNLSGYKGNDTLYGNAGNDFLEGGEGNDTYVFGIGDGIDTIFDYDTYNSNKDMIYLDSNLKDIVFSRDGNDLKISIAGSNDEINIKSWYSGVDYQIEELRTANNTLLSNQVDQLIQAMATFTQNTGMSWDQALQEKPDDVQNILSQFWVLQEVN